MDWEWPIFGKGQRRLFLVYNDMFGADSQREIMPTGFAGVRIKRRASGDIDDTVEKILAYCFLRKEARTFNIASIKGLADAETGETISDPQRWAEENYNPIGGYSPARNASEPQSLPPGPRPLPTPEAEAVVPIPRWGKAKAIMWSLLVGYLIGRTRVIPWVLGLLNQHWGRWL